MPIFKPKPEQIQRNLMENELQFGREQTAMELSESPEMVPIDLPQKNEDLTRWQQDLEGELDIVGHDFRNEFLNNGEWKKQLNSDKTPMKSIMNERGITAFKRAVRASLSRNLMMSNYTQEMILVKLKGIVFKFLGHFIEGRTQFAYLIRLSDAHVMVQIALSDYLGVFNKRIDGVSNNRIQKGY